MYSQSRIFSNINGISIFTILRRWIRICLLSVPFDSLRFTTDVRLKENTVGTLETNANVKSWKWRMRADGESRINARVFFSNGH